MNEQKTKVLIKLSVTITQLVCNFVFSCTKKFLSQDGPHIFILEN